MLIAPNALRFATVERLRTPFKNIYLLSCKFETSDYFIFLYILFFRSLNFDFVQPFCYIPYFLNLAQHLFLKDYYLL